MPTQRDGFFQLCAPHPTHHSDVVVLSLILGLGTPSLSGSGPSPLLFSIFAEICQQLLVSGFYGSERKREKIMDAYTLIHSILLKVLWLKYDHVYCLPKRTSHIFLNSMSRSNFQNDGQTNRGWPNKVLMFVDRC